MEIGITVFIVIVALALLLVRFAKSRGKKKPPSAAATTVTPVVPSVTAPDAKASGWLTFIIWLIAVLVIISLALSFINFKQRSDPPSHVSSYVAQPKPLPPAGYLKFQHPKRNYQDKFLVTIEKKENTLILEGRDGFLKPFTCMATRKRENLFTGRCEWPKGWSDFRIKLIGEQSGEGEIDVTTGNGKCATVTLILSPV